MWRINCFIDINKYILKSNCVCICECKQRQEREEQSKSEGEREREGEKRERTTYNYNTAKTVEICTNDNSQLWPTQICPTVSVTLFCQLTATAKLRLKAKPLYRGRVVTSTEIWRYYSTALNLYSEKLRMMVQIYWPFVKNEDLLGTSNITDFFYFRVSYFVYLQHETSGMKRATCKIYTGFLLYLPLSSPSYNMPKYQQIISTYVYIAQWNQHIMRATV